MRHLYIATPVYDQTVSTGYAQSLAMTIVACTRVCLMLSGPDFRGGPYVEINRNWLVHRFLQSRADALLFVDADVTWDENAVLKLYDSGLDLCGGAYPKKEARENYPVRLLEGRQGEFREAIYIPGGFMLIRRRVFDALRPLVPDYPDPGHSNERVASFFQNKVYAGGGWVGEDVEFCNRWRLAGGRVWLYPNIDFGHQGAKEWTGNYAKAHPALAAVQPDGTLRAA